MQLQRVARVLRPFSPRTIARADCVRWMDRWEARVTKYMPNRNLIQELRWVSVEKRERLLDLLRDHLFPAHFDLNRQRRAHCRTLRDLPAHQPGGAAPVFRQVEHGAIAWIAHHRV